MDNMADLIIFDVDGTLFETQYVTVPAVQQAFAGFGLPVPPNRAFARFLGNLWKRMKHGLSDNARLVWRRRWWNGPMRLNCAL